MRAGRPAGAEGRAVHRAAALCADAHAADRLPGDRALLCRRLSCRSWICGSCGWCGCCGCSRSRAIRRRCPRSAMSIREERRALYGTLLLMLCAMVFAAAAMHAAEGRVQPQAFGSMPESDVVGDHHAHHGGLWRCRAGHRARPHRRRHHHAGRAWPVRASRSASWPPVSSIPSTGAISSSPSAC